MGHALRALASATDHGLQDEHGRQGHAPAAQLVDQDTGKLARADDHLRGGSEERDGGTGGGTVEGHDARNPHDLGDMGAPGWVAAGVVPERRGRDVELTGDVGQHAFRRDFARLQDPSRHPQAQKHEREAELIGVAAPQGDEVELLRAEGAMAGDLPLVRGPSEMSRPDLVVQ